MPNNRGVKPSAESSVVQTRRNWLQRAKDFLINNCGMYDMGDNAKLNISENHINAGVVVIANISRVEKEDSQEADEQSHGPEIPTQDDARPSGEALPATLVQSQKKNNDLSTSSPSDLDNAFDSEATAEYPDVLLCSSKAYPSVSRARTHIYSLEMLTHGVGYPLYIPTPSRGLPAAYRKKGIRVGDVGVITPNGAFDFLFNACQHNDQSDAGVNPATLPDCFKLLKAVIRVNDKFDHGECLPSDHVDEICGSESHTFQCSASEGAVLALPTGATAYEAVNTHHFETHAARHAASWYEYVLKEGRDVSNGSLYFVTECIKSKNWGISVFYGRTRASDDLRVTFNEGSCQWGRRGKVEARVGPKSNDIVLSDDDEPNQCVFLRGFKMMLRLDVWDKLKGGIVVTTQDGESSSAPFPTRTTHSQIDDMSDTSQASSLHQSASDGHDAPGLSHNARQVILEDNFREAVPLHPSDLINVMLLHLKPEASVALVHDSVWCDHLPHDFMADPVNPNVYGLLENIKQAYEAGVGQHGNAVLIDIESDPKVSHPKSGSSGKGAFAQGDLRASPPFLSSDGNDEDTVMSDLDAIERSLPNPASSNLNDVYMPCSQRAEPETLDDRKVNLKIEDHGYGDYLDNTSYPTAGPLMNENAQMSDIHYLSPTVAQHDLKLHPYTADIQFQPTNGVDIDSESKRPRYSHPDAPDEHEVEDHGDKEGLNPRPGACSRCKTLKVKCAFKTDTDPCKRCLDGGHKCIIPLAGRKKRRAPQTVPNLYPLTRKRQHLLNQIREQAAQIQKLTSQLEATNKGNSERPLTPKVSLDVSSDHINMAGANMPRILLKDVTGITGEDFFRPESTLTDVGHHLPHLLSCGIITVAEVEALFKIYFDNMNLSLSLLDPVLYTAQDTFVRSPFLFTVICAISSRFYSKRPDLYETAMRYAHISAGMALIDGKKDVDTCHAYILMSLCYLPVKTLEKQQSWLYLGIAIRVATELNLHLPVATIPQDEKQAREVLNRARVWMNCFNLDRSAGQYGKPPIINSMDYQANHSQNWWKSSPFNMRNFDIHTCCYNHCLRTTASFVAKIYNDPENPTGFNQNAEFERLAAETDDQLQSLQAHWFTVIQENTDQEDIQNKFRTRLLKLAYSHDRLIILSYGFQHAFGKNNTNENPFLQRCINAAEDVLHAVVDDICGDPRMRIFWRHGPEAQSVFVTFASAFLVNFLQPKLTACLSSEKRHDIRNKVQRVIDLLSSPDIAIDNSHGPKLCAKFLRGLLAFPLTRLESQLPAASPSAVPRSPSNRRSETAVSSVSWDSATTAVATGSSPSPPDTISFHNFAPLKGAVDGTQVGIQNAMGLEMNMSDWFNPPMSIDTQNVDNLQQTLGDPAATWNSYDWLSHYQTFQQNIGLDLRSAGEMIMEDDQYNI